MVALALVLAPDDDDMFLQMLRLMLLQGLGILLLLHTCTHTHLEFVRGCILLSLIRTRSDENTTTVLQVLNKK